MYSFTTPNGKLKNDFLPAVYYDSSVIIDHWITEDMEQEWPAGGKSLYVFLYGGELQTLVRDLLKSDVRINKVVELRKKISFADVKVSPVTRETALWELQEWIAESGLKQRGSEISGTVSIQKKGKKEIGDLLKKALDLWLAEGDEKHHDPKTGTSALHSIQMATTLNFGFAESHGLHLTIR